MNRENKPKAVYVGKSSRTPSSACLGCGKQVDAGTGIGHRHRPRAGSITVCFYCGHIQAYDSELKMRPLTDEEIVMVAGDERILAFQRARAVVLAMGKKPT